MPFARLTPERQQQVAVLVPFCALALSLFVVYPAWGHYNDLYRTAEQRQRELENLRAVPVLPLGVRIPAEDESPSEPSAFLGRLNQMATSAGCTIAGLDVTPAAKGNGIAPVRAKVDLEGSYQQVRSFLDLVRRDGRLLAIAEVDIAQAGP